MYRSNSNKKVFSYTPRNETIPGHVLLTQSLNSVWISPSMPTGGPAHEPPNMAPH